MSDVVSETVALFGGNLPTAQLCGVSAQAVSNWKAEGFIPERHHYRIFQAAQARGLDLPAGWNLVPERAPQGGQPEQVAS